MSAAASTGATERRIGRFEQAEEGTLFLDEVGDLSLEAQAKLLRALEAGEIERVGGERPITVDVRIVSATNKDLQRGPHAKDSSARTCSNRLNVFPIHIPPLRERPGDIPELWRISPAWSPRASAGPRRASTRGAMQRLIAHRWPGNVRELGEHRRAPHHPGAGAYDHRGRGARNAAGGRRCRGAATRSRRSCRPADRLPSTGTSGR